MDTVKQTPREILQSILTRPMTDGACEQLHLSPGTSYLTGLLLGAVERALRGDNAAWSAVMNFADPPIIDVADDYVDGLSASLMEMIAEQLDNQNQSESVR